MQRLRDWIAKRIGWRAWGSTVTVNGEPYVPESVAERLFKERCALAKKYKAEQARRREAEAKNRTPGYRDLP